jgi:predicted nucleic acid-binding protein
MTKVLVDSNILIYSLQKQALGKHDDANIILKELAKEGRLTLSVQNLAETSRVILEKSTMHDFDEDELASRLSTLAQLSFVIKYGPITVAQAIRLAKTYKIHFFDALLAATMQENAIDEIYTENIDDFKKIPWVKARNPLEIGKIKKN